MCCFRYILHKRTTRINYVSLTFTFFGVFVVYIYKLHNPGKVYCTAPIL